MTQSEKASSAIRMRVLIVDDSALIRLYFRQALEGAGFEVEQAINGIEAMEKVLAEMFDLAIVDVNMPKMDGLSFIRKLRRNGSDVAALPILMVTTEAGQKDIEEARAVGANFYLVKPISETDLVRYVAALAGVGA